MYSGIGTSIELILLRCVHTSGREAGRCIARENSPKTVAIFTSQPQLATPHVINKINFNFETPIAGCSLVSCLLILINYYGNKSNDNNYWDNYDQYPNSTSNPYHVESLSITSCSMCKIILTILVVIVSLQSNS